MQCRYDCDNRDQGYQHVGEVGVEAARLQSLRHRDHECKRPAGGPVEVLLDYLEDVGAVADMREGGLRGRSLPGIARLSLRAVSLSAPGAWSEPGDAGPGMQDRRQHPPGGVGEPEGCVTVVPRDAGGRRSPGRDAANTE